MKTHSRVFVLILSLSLGLYSISQAGSVICFEACLERQPVLTMDCCEDADSMVHMAMNGGTKQEGSEPESCCQPELCPDLYHQPNNFVFCNQDTSDSVVFLPPQSFGNSITRYTPSTEPWKPDPQGLRVSLYTLHCSFLN